MADDTYARGIAAHGVHLASEILHPDNIHRPALWFLKEMTLPCMGWGKLG